jgi:hypothetical protein
MPAAFSFERSSALLQHEKQQRCCSGLRYDQTASGGMQFGHGAGDCIPLGSTQRQHCSGLGLDAQRSAIDRFAATESLKMAAEYVEAKTGKGADALDRRPQLAAGRRKAAKCSVVVAKLDRLSRDVAFVTGLMAPACALHRGRTWSRRRSIYAAPLRGHGRE